MQEEIKTGGDRGNKGWQKPTGIYFPDILPEEGVAG
jgi:hypothetical protein